MTKHIILLIFILSCLLYADKVITNDGKEFEGKIIEENERFVIIDVNGFKNTIWRVLIKEVIKSDGVTPAATAPATVPAAIEKTHPSATPSYSEPTTEDVSVPSYTESSDNVETRFSDEVESITESGEVEFKIGYAVIGTKKGKVYDCEIIEILPSKIVIKYKGISKKLKKYTIQHIEYK